MTISLAVVENGALIESTGTRAPVPWWSFTKTVIAAAALVLVEEGRLALDDALDARPYSLRQLLQHRAGLPDYGELAEYHAAVARGDKPWPVPVMLARAEADRLRFPPGEGWGYSDIGYLLVRRAIEEATGDALGPALRRLVLRPLGIEAARLAETPGDLGEVAMGSAEGYHPGWVYHGLLVGPLGEAALLLHRLMAGALLEPAMLEAMRQAHRLLGPIPGRPWSAPGYGLGLMSGTGLPGLPVAGHTGGGPGSAIAVYNFPDAAPARTVATFSLTEQAAIVEQAAFDRGR